MLTWFEAVATAAVAVPALTWAFKSIAQRIPELRPTASFRVSERGSKDPFAWATDRVIQLQPDLAQPPPDAVILAVPGDGGFIWSFAIDLSSKLRRPSTVTGIQAVIVKQRPAPSGTFYFVAPQGDARRGTMGFDLGSNDLQARIVDDNRSIADDHYLAHRLLTLGVNETLGHIIMIRAPMNVDIEFKLLFQFEHGKDVLVTDDLGVPFRIATYPEHPQCAYTWTKLDEHGEFGIYSCQWPDGCRNSMLNVRTDP